LSLLISFFLIAILGIVNYCYNTIRINQLSPKAILPVNFLFVIKPLPFRINSSLLIFIL
ncbi:MAG: hypothetical protein US67_C0077G0001, partial [Candidatus Woesebacteria bacterium GW2011_GWD1_38_10]